MMCICVCFTCVCGWDAIWNFSKDLDTSGMFECINVFLFQNVKNTIRRKAFTRSLLLCMVRMSAHLFTWMQYAAGKYFRRDRSDERRRKKIFERSKVQNRHIHTFKIIIDSIRTICAYCICYKIWVGEYCCRAVLLYKFIKINASGFFFQF